MHPFDIHSLGPVGIEIRGVDLRESLTDTDFAVLRTTIMEAGLVLFRDQCIERDLHVSLGERFGQLENLSPNAEDESAGLIVIGNLDAEGQVLPSDSPFMRLISINEGWHTDSSFRPIPASFSLFSAVVVPTEGGGTWYADLARAWDRLPEAEKTSLYGLNAVHDYASAYRARGNEKGSIVGFDDPPVVHPLVRRHPETGRPVLYVSEHVASIEGWTEESSRVLLDRLIAHATAEDQIYRHDWRVGDFAIWDNRSMLHRAQGFDGLHARVMHHVRVSGSESPVAAMP